MDVKQLRFPSSSSNLCLTCRNFNILKLLWPLICETLGFITTDENAAVTFKDVVYRFLKGQSKNNTSISESVCFFSDTSLNITDL